MALEMPAKQRPHHYDTPHRCRVKGVFEYFAKTGRVLSSTEKHEIFKIMNVSKSSGYEILKGSDRTRHNDPAKPNETRGRKLKTSGDQVAEADQIGEETQDAADKSFTGVEIDTEVCPPSVQQSTAGRKRRSNNNTRGNTKRAKKTS